MKTDTSLAAWPRGWRPARPPLPLPPFPWLFVCSGKRALYQNVVRLKTATEKIQGLIRVRPLVKNRLSFLCVKLSAPCVKTVSATDACYNHVQNPEAFLFALPKFSLPLTAVVTEKATPMQAF